jgi:toluene monooxygenase system ferredoxin subunit
VAQNETRSAARTPFEEKTMAFVSVCEHSDVQPGQMRLVRCGKRSVLLVWPQGGEIRAYRGRCPHQDIPLDTATFDGKIITCSHHEWKMDAATGACVGRVEPPKCQLAPYALRVEGDQLQVDLP